jgi:hypothetical protein
LPKSHPEPSPAIAKELYANAAKCAYPECEQPLYRVNADGSRTLNSRIAHICARQESGPRWDPNMSSADNRSVGNLLLLCIEHADEIDQPARVGMYPATVLDEWKREQLAYFDTHKNGWQITESEAEEIIRESTRLEVTIQAEVVNIGGLGGAAQGSGGGGGGAIGHSVRGGRGGKGGDNGPIRINLRGGDGGAPGAGGGGSGGIDPDSPLFWRGGDTMPTFGSSSFLGIDGMNGGDTTFGPAGTKPLIRAKGGRGGLVGTGNRFVSEKVTVSSVMLASYIEFRDAFAYISGACFQFYNILNEGDTLGFSGIFVLECGGVGTGEYGVTVSVLDPQNSEVSSMNFAFNISRVGDILRIPFKFGIRVVVTAFGMWTIVVRHGERELARLPVVIQQGITGT